jgi:hypothetical protein
MIATTLWDISKRPLSGSLIIRIPDSPTSNPIMPVNWKVARQPILAIKGLLNVDRGYPAYDPIEYKENAKVLCSWGNKSEIRLKVDGPKKLMKIAYPVLKTRRCQNFVANPLKKVIVDQPKQA